MSYLTLRPAGTPLGPCPEGDCAHRDCAATRAQAAALCPLCQEPCDYEQPLTRDAADRLCHFFCLVTAVEAPPATARKGVV